jgi:hypothetical protein
LPEQRDGISGLAFLQLLRRAIMGETRDARRAGIYPATSATVASKKIMQAKVAGSSGLKSEVNVEDAQKAPQQ